MPDVRGCAGLSISDVRVAPIDHRNMRRSLCRVPNRKRGTMSKFFSWHVWAAAAIAVAAVLITIFDPSPLILIAIFFALCVYIVVEIRKRKLS
jgi:hypothetical protein